MYHMKTWPQKSGKLWPLNECGGGGEGEARYRQTKNGKTAYAFLRARSLVSSRREHANNV